MKSLHLDKIFGKAVILVLQISLLLGGNIY